MSTEKEDVKQKTIIRVIIGLLLLAVVAWIVVGYNHKYNVLDQRNDQNKETIQKIDQQQQLYDSLSIIIEKQKEEIMKHKVLLDSFKIISTKFHDQINSLKIESKNIGEAARLLRENIEKEKAKEQKDHEE